MEKITVINFCSPQIKKIIEDTKCGKISTVHITFDSQDTAIAFPQWLRMCSSNFTYSVKDNLKAKELIMVWHGTNLENAEFMSTTDAKEFVDDKILEINIVSPE